MHHMLTLCYKEWLELRHHRTLVAGLLIPPFMLTMLPIVTVWLSGFAPPGDMAEEMNRTLTDPALAQLSGLELGQAMIGQQFGLLFMMLPLIIPNVISSYSIVGEKTNRTLEPLLATPISTSALLLGKAFTAMVPAVGITWVCGSIFIISMARFTVSPAVFTAIVSPAWLLLLIIAAPLMSLISILLTLAISSRVNDPRSAQQIVAVLIIPVMLFFFAQTVGFVSLNIVMVMLLVLALAIIAACCLWLVVRLFQRETILTRWR
ncbi:MAG: ABC transporter permease [Chloroflexaceae bacterium]|nr:ABC transporter permease [Chloroflexaceae bacterium]